jgi:hypothetical protein
MPFPFVDTVLWRPTFVTPTARDKTLSAWTDPTADTDIPLPLSVRLSQRFAWTD